MARYVDLNDVRTWYDERGEGEPLVLLHGGFSDSRDFAGNLDALGERFRLCLPERSGPRTSSATATGRASGRWPRCAVPT
jgi:pimeloyl-ACP methyl ester carboxylesterase